MEQTPPISNPQSSENLLPVTFGQVKPNSIRDLLSPTLRSQSCFWHHERGRGGYFIVAANHFRLTTEKSVFVSTEYPLSIDIGSNQGSHCVLSDRGAPLHLVEDRDGAK